MSEQVILVNEQDEPIGTMEKLAAHKLCSLHRAISVLLVHPDGRILLQLRGKNKYHGAGRWTTTTCSHPREGESADAAAARRLEEEMGIVCPLSKMHEFVYKAPVGEWLWEHEYLHVYFGTYDGPVAPHPDEADGYRWIEPYLLRYLIDYKTRRFSPRFLITLQELEEKNIFSL